ncbi:MAG: ammonia channel protein, partial [Betaproteobacteria bacterium]
MKKWLINLASAGLLLFAIGATPIVSAEDAAPAAAPGPNKGDTAWMMVATISVIMMCLPGLALFYGGLGRSKNML